MLLPELVGDELLDSVALETKVKALSASGKNFVSIDLSPLDYIYSDSINKFIGINRILHSANGRLVLVVPHEKVFDLLTRAGVAKQIKIVRNPGELHALSDYLLEHSPALKAQTPPVAAPKTEEPILPSAAKDVDDFSDLKQILSDTLTIGEDSEEQNNVVQSAPAPTRTMPTEDDIEIENEIFAQKTEVPAPISIVEPEHEFALDDIVDTFEEKPDITSVEPKANTVFEESFDDLFVDEPAAPAAVEVKAPIAPAPVVSEPELEIELPVAVSEKTEQTVEKPIEADISFEMPEIEIPVEKPAATPVVEPKVVQAAAVTPVAPAPTPEPDPIPEIVLDVDFELPKPQAEQAVAPPPPPPPPPAPKTEPIAAAVAKMAPPTPTTPKPSAKAAIYDEGFEYTNKKSRKKGGAFKAILILLLLLILIAGAFVGGVIFTGQTDSLDNLLSRFGLQRAGEQAQPSLPIENVEVAAETAPTEVPVVPAAPIPEPAPAVAPTPPPAAPAPAARPAAPARQQAQPQRQQQQQRQQQAQRPQAQPQRGIQITTQPAGAQIFVNDDFRGRTPFTLTDIPRGRVVIRARLDGFSEHEWSPINNNGSAALPQNLTVSLQRREAQPPPQQAVPQAPPPQQQPQQTQRQERQAQQAERDRLAREQAERDRLAREQAAREQQARDQATRDQQARDQAARDQAAREQAARDQATREQTAREQAERDRLAREQAARDQQARDQAAREQAARDQAAREQAERDRVAREREQAAQAERDRVAREQAERERLAREEAARQAALEAQEATIFFTSQPPNAEIFHNGVSVGRTGVAPVRIRPGEYTFEFKRTDDDGRTLTGTWTGRLRDGRNPAAMIRLQ